MPTKFFIFVCYTKRHLCAKFEQNRTRNKEVAKMGNDVIVTSFLKIAQQFFVCEYFLPIPIVVPSFKLIEGQIKELQGVVPNTPRAENDQKRPGRIGLRLGYKMDSLLLSTYHTCRKFSLSIFCISALCITRL